MTRKLSHIEHIVEGNIVYFVRLEGQFDENQLRTALWRLQRKHPALRLLVREEPDGLYYEFDSAPDIPLRIVQRINEDDYRRECERELKTDFGHGQTLLRAVWLQADTESDLLLSTSHRICDGASMLILVKELLRALHAEDDLIPYSPITRRDIIGELKVPPSRKRKFVQFLLNPLLRAIPESQRPADNEENIREWNAGRELSDLLKQRCKQEKVSVHAAFLVALDRTLDKVFGHKAPKWIENPVDIRRGRFVALKEDMLFFGGGNFKVLSKRFPDMEFWTRVRLMHSEIREKVDKELRNIPGRFEFSEGLRPLTRGQVRSVVRFGDALKMNGSWNRFAFSNLGNIVVTEPEAPILVKDLRLYMHSVNFRVLCLVTYTLNGEMRFYCAGDKRCLSAKQAEVLQREFMEVLGREVRRSEDFMHDAARALAAVAP